MAGKPQSMPAAAGEREPILDVLRGFAIFGILLVNIELFRGAELFRLLAGADPALSAADRTAQFAVGWLVTGKFLSSFALLFGVGAALQARRAAARGRSPRGLLARRYGLLAVLGLAHMLLLFAGDILFAYSLAGLLLLAFVGVRPRTAVRWSAGLLAAVALVVAVLSAPVEPPPDDPFAAEIEQFFAERADHAVAAYTTGSFGDQIVARAWEALIVQTVTLLLLPWILALFLLGLAVGKSGIIDDLVGRRRVLRVGAAVGLGLGLPLNLPLGLVGPLGGVGPTAAEPVTAVAAGVAAVVAAPLLAVGYLCALALVCLRRGPARSLAAVGRMALSAYLLQSVLCWAVFVGAGLYDRLSGVQALLVVGAVWAVILLVCPWWLRHFRFGPAEWLWRTLTYGRGQPLRASAAR